MARHRRQQASARRSTLRKPGRRLNFEGLEGRNLLSAVGWPGAAPQPWPMHEPWAGLPNISMPPAIVGGFQPLRPEGNSLVPARYEAPIVHAPQASFEVMEPLLTASFVETAPRAAVFVAMNTSYAMPQAAGLYAAPQAIDSGSIDAEETGVPLIVASAAAAVTSPSQEEEAPRHAPDAVADELYGGLEQVNTMQFAAGATSIAAVSWQATHTVSHTVFAFDAPPLGPMIVDDFRAPRFVFDVVGDFQLPMDPRPAAGLTDTPNRPIEATVASSSQEARVDLSPMADDAAENSTPVAGRKSDPPALYDPAASASSVAVDSVTTTQTTVNVQTQALPREKTAEFAGSNYGEGGFVAIEDASATSLHTGTSATISSTDDTPDAGNGGLWSELSPGARKQARQAADSDSPRSGKPVAADVSDHARGQARPQTAADSADGGLIELADAAPVTAAAADGESGAAAGDSAQVASEIRPESGVALYCDMQVAVGGPFGDQAIGDEEASAAAPAGGDRSATRAENSREAQAKQTSQEVSIRIDTRQRVSSWWTGRMPLWASVALAALLDGIWRKRAEPDRQRGIHPFGRFWRRERN